MALTKKQTLKRIYCTGAGLLVVVALLLSISSCAKANRVKTIELTLMCGDTYEIGNENNNERDYARLAQTSFVSTDESVATLLAGYIIVTQSPGEATLTITSDEETIRYHVFVTEEGDRGSSTYHDLATYNFGRIGYGFNALQYDEVNLNTLSEPVLDWNKVIASNHLYYEEKNQSIMNFYGGTSFSEFQKELEQKTGYEIRVKIFGIKFSKKKQFLSASTEKREYTEIWGQITYDIIKGSFYLQYTKKLLNQCIEDNARSALYGPNALKPENLFRKYGTHIVIAGNYGGGAVYNYRIFDNSEEQSKRRGALVEWYGAHQVCEHYEERLKYIWSFARKPDKNYLYHTDFWDILNEITNYKLGFNFAGTNIDGYLSAWENREIETYFDMAFIGSDYLLGTEGNDIDPYNAIVLMNILSSADMDIYTEDFIGPRDSKSMYPIWDLIPQDSEENIARRKELMDYYYSKIQ